jgi:outer membrane protein assembly complex protein YaeT
MRALALLMLILTAALAAAQEGGPPPLGAVVKSITISPAPSESVYELLEFRVGMPLAPEALRTSLKNIFRLGIYSDVRALWQPVAGGVAITIELEEIPLIEGVTVLGNGPLSKRTVISAARLDSNVRFNADRGQEITALIEQRYKAAGYWAADVSLYSMVNLETGGIRLEININPGEATVLREFNLDGFPVLPREEILSVLRRTGLKRPFREDAFRRELELLKKHYFAQGYLTADVAAGVPVFDREANAVDLNLTINAGPQIALNFKPGESAPRGWQDLIPFQDRNVPLDRIVENGRRNIERRVQSQGFIDAVVRSTVEVDFELGSVNIDIGLERGVGFKVGRLTIEGIDRGLQDKIWPQLSLTKKGWFAAATYSRENLEADVRRVLQLLWNEGYRNAAVLDRRLERRDAEMRVDVTLVFDSGAPTRTREVFYQGNKSFTTERLADVSRFRTGQVISADALTEALERLRQFYDSEGFAEARIAANIPSTGDTPDLIFEISEGERSSVAKVIIAGNEITNEGVIRNALTFREGSPYSRTGLAESQRTLYRLGIFNRVVVSGVDEQLGRPDRRVVVRVSETSPYSLLYGIGVDSEEKLRFSFGVSNSNVLGRNIEVSFSTRVSKLQQRYQLSFRAPRTFRGRIDNIVRLFYEEVRDLGFSARRKGLMVESTGFSTAGWDIALRYQFKWIDLFDEQPGVFISRFERNIKLSLLSTILTRDHRDDIVDPTDGYLASAIIQYSPGWLGSEAEFVKSQFQFYFYRPMPARSVLAGGARLGLAWPFSGSEDLPLSEQFFFNGITTLRGFELSEVRPEEIPEKPYSVYGNALLVSNLEFRFPLWWELGGVVFYDFGSAFPYVGDFDFGNLVHASGLGLRYATPLGPLRVDYSWDLSGYDRALVFSFGHAF